MREAYLLKRRTMVADRGLFFFLSPGRIRVFSGFNCRPAGDFANLFVFSDLTARAMAVYVFPDPAGPMAKSRSFSSKAFTSFCWLGVRATMGFPPIP